MSTSTALRRLALPLLVAISVLYLFGMRSPVTSVALLVISGAVLCLVMASMHQGACSTQEALDSCEQTHNFAGWNFRVFVDDCGEIWLRATDLKRFLEHDKTDAWLARRYPSRYGKVHPKIDTWYIRHDALRDFIGKNRSDGAQRFLAWINREIIGMHRFERAMASPSAHSRQIKQTPPRNFLFGWFIRHWRGEAGLMSSVFGGAVVVACANWAVYMLETPVDITLHYRLFGLIYVTQLLVVSGGMYWWGRGVLHSTQRWIAADRSLFVALGAVVLGFGGVFHGLGQIVDTEKQYFLTDFFTIMLDADLKPTIRYDASANRITLDGDLGFGTTNHVRQALLDHPQAKSIELKSYGGRTAEGFELMGLIFEHKLETYVRAECMSACVYAYAGGRQRYIAGSAKFGLHRSGYHWQAGEDGLNSTDRAFANALRTIGVDGEFITRGLKPSIHEMYEPTPEEVLAARLATAEWL